jgi:hypothetical protein
MRRKVSLTSLGRVAAIACLAATPLSLLSAEEGAREPPRVLDKSSSIDIRPPHAGAIAGLDESDEIAALEAIRVALTEVGDGGTFVWRRRFGRLSGIVQPTLSFKNAAGHVCRRILVIMTVGTATGRAEGVACRLADGRWQLDG